MTEPGRTKAADIKRRIMTACQKAGLTVQGGKFYHRPSRGDRVVQVGAVTPEGPCRTGVIDMWTLVQDNGEWSGCIDIACGVDDGGARAGSDAPLIMLGRELVPLDCLVEELRNTVAEREQVAAALRLGVEGPYVFRRSRWETPPEIAES